MFTFNIFQQRQSINKCTPNYWNIILYSNDLHFRVYNSLLSCWLCRQFIPDVVTRAVGNATMRQTRNIVRFQFKLAWNVIVHQHQNPFSIQPKHLTPNSRYIKLKFISNLVIVLIGFLIFIRQMKICSLFIQLVLLVSPLMLVGVSHAADDTFTNDALQAHNDYRAKHGAPPMTISQSVIYSFFRL